jgi:glycosyltransferase involved in cell wall biosynthesis
MRIGIDTRFLHLGLTHSKEIDLLGGVAGYLYYLVTHLLETDQSNTYVLLADASRPIGPFRKLVSGKANVEFLSIASPFHIPLVDASLGAAVRLAQDRLHKLPQIVRADLDVLHTHEDVLGLERVSTHEVVSIHAFLGRRGTAGGLGHHLWRKKLNRLGQAARLVAISDGLKQDIVDCLGIASDRVVTIHHGYASKLFRPMTSQTSVESTLTRYGLKAGYLLYVGGLAPVKNVPNVLRAYKTALTEHQLDMPLVLCGIVSRFYKREYVKVRMLIRRLGLEESVRIISYVPHHDLPSFFNGAVAVLSPSFSEGFGLVPLEAMACGTPVVVSNRPAMPEIAGDAGYYVDPEDVGQIAQGVYDLVHDGELRARLRDRGLDRAKAFSWERCVQETSKLYGDVVHAN